MQQVVNENYQAVFTQKPRYIILMGGRSGGRSYVASQYALAKLVAPQYFRCAIMRYLLTDIRNSIYQEILDRSDESEIRENLIIKDHLLTIQYGVNKVVGIGFRKSSADQKSKLKSLANYNCVIIEEADEVAEEDFLQLDDSLRTIKSDIVVIMMLNPPFKNHWIIKRFFNLLPSEQDGFYRAELKSNCTDTLFIHSTYRDNIKNMNQSTIDNFSNYKKTRPDHYWNMIEGLVSEGARGRIYKTWKPVTDKEFEELPHEKYYGLDFGFTNDPTSLIEIKEHNDKVWFRELIYESGLTNDKIAERMKQLGVDENAVIYADCAEPKSIAELVKFGWNVQPSVKGKDSINAGIDMLLQKEAYYTESSENIAKEAQEYVWALDRNKEPTNVPIDEMNHAMDAIRYGIFTKSKQAFIGFV